MLDSQTSLTKLNPLMERLIPIPHVTSQLTFWWSWFENLSASVRSGDALSAYIYLISRRTSTVGIIQGINGISQVGPMMVGGTTCFPIDVVVPCIVDEKSISVLKLQSI